MQGNRSASWADNKRYLVLQIGLSLFFSLPFVVLGYWVIVCFLLAFYLCLVVAFWQVAKTVVRVAQLQITESSVAYSPPISRRHSPRYQYKNPRTLVAFDLLKGSSRCYSNRLTMRVSDNRVIIGEALSDPERVALLERLDHFVDAGFDFVHMPSSSETVSIPIIDDGSFSAL